jgi:hypothetical protein
VLAGAIVGSVVGVVVAVALALVLYKTRARAMAEKTFEVPVNAKV